MWKGDDKLANKISVGGRASSKCGKRPCTRAARKTSWAWHQMRCWQASETSGQSGGAVGPHQLWGGSISTGSDNSICWPKTSRTTSPVRCKHTALPHHQGLYAFLTRRQLGRRKERAATFPGPSHSVPSIVGFFFFFYGLRFRLWGSNPYRDLSPTQAQTPWWKLDLLLGFFHSTPPLSGESLLFPKSIMSNSWPRVLKPLTSSLQNLLRIRWGHLCPFPWEGADLSQEVYFSTLLLEWDQVAFPWPWPLAKWTKSGHLIQLGQSWEYVALEDFG